MDYYLTQHAADVLEVRRIPTEWMERVDADLQHRLGRIRESENRVLRVIVNPTATPPRIVTVYFDRRRKDR